VDLPDSSRFFRRAAVSSARARAHSSDIGEILGLQSCLKAPAIPIHEMFHPRDVAEQHSRLSGWGGSRGDRARPSPGCCQSRPAIAHRDSTAYTLQGWFPGSGVVRVCSSDRLGAFPNPIEGRWLLCRVQRSTTVAGAAPAFTGFPILLPVVDGQAPSATGYYLIFSRRINDTDDDAQLWS
jgi:hypothetical protein